MPQESKFVKTVGSYFNRLVDSLPRALLIQVAAKLDSACGAGAAASSQLDRTVNHENPQIVAAAFGLTFPVEAESVLTLREEECGISPNITCRGIGICIGCTIIVADIESFAAAIVGGIAGIPAIGLRAVFQHPVAGLVDIVVGIVFKAAGVGEHIDRLAGRGADAAEDGVCTGVAGTTDSAHFEVVGSINLKVRGLILFDRSIVDHRVGGTFDDHFPVGLVGTGRPGEVHLSRGKRVDSKGRRNDASGGSTDSDVVDKERQHIRGIVVAEANVDGLASIGSQLDRNLVPAILRCQHSVLIDWCRSTQSSDSTRRADVDGIGFGRIACRSRLHPPRQFKVVTRTDSDGWADKPVVGRQHLIATIQIRIRL